MAKKKQKRRSVDSFVYVWCKSMYTHKYIYVCSV